MIVYFRAYTCWYGLFFLFFTRSPYNPSVREKGGTNMNYTTQMDAARKGILTKELMAVAEHEQWEPEKLRELVAEGKVAIPANKNHRCLKPSGIGSMLRTKINVNLGTSRDLNDLDMELLKVKDAVLMGAESIMDLSSFGDTQRFRRKLTGECPAMIGTVPIYDAVVYYHKPLREITAEEWIKIVEMHAEDGVDFMTIHVGINKLTAKRFKEAKRLTNIVSRGGSIIFAWMEMTGEENPFYEHYDRILEICQKHDVTLSLGDACRPGCIEDASDISQVEELVTLGELTRRAWEKDVQIIIEGPGHMPLDQIAANMKIQQSICKGAPFYVLGPLVTDIAPGYDHITAAIGGAVAAAAGAAFLCYVTPAEHLRLPDEADVKEGIIAARIAAHAADIAKGIRGAKEWDHKMSDARKRLDWETMFQLAIDPEKARRYRAASKPEKEDTCSMCGNFCAMKNMNRILDGEIVDIFDE
jgi:phosphomethylpyrimidine synthase